jgi:hypothetical protein
MSNEKPADEVEARLYWRTLCREQFAGVGLPDAAWAFALSCLAVAAIRTPHIKVTGSKKTLAASWKFD